MTTERVAARLESLRKQAKQWLKLLRSGDQTARERFRLAHPKPPTEPALRDVQHALARELGFASWAILKAHSAGDERHQQDSLHAIFEAAGKGDVERLKTLLDSHPALINERAEFPGSFGKRTALHYGVDHAPVVKLLLERGADPNIRDDGDNATPLHFAAEHQDLAVIQMLIEHGADPIGDGTMHELDVLGWATAWDYIQAKPEVVQYLLSHGAQHSIFSAVAMGAIDEIRTIVSREPDALNRPMDATNSRRRPLHLAIKKGQRTALEVLLALGADTEARDRTGLTPLDQAALAGEHDSARLLLDHGASLDLPAAVALGRTTDIERLLAQEPQCLKPGHKWGTLIVRAAERAPAPVIEALLRHGASPDARDDVATGNDRTLGTTALHLAAFRGNADAVRVLLAHGADPAARESEHGSTPLGWAAYAGQEATRQLLLNAPFDIFDAIVTESIARIEEILDTDPGALHKTFGETTGLKNGASYATPLVWAVGHNKPRIVKLLLDRGARVIDAPDGETMLEHAVDKGYDEIAALVRNLPSQPAPTHDIAAEAQRAVRNGDHEALEGLLEHHDAFFRTLGAVPADTEEASPDYTAMDAKEIIRQNHGFETWERYQRFRQQMRIALSQETRFEAAADAIVNGQVEELRWLLRSHPSLVREHSTRGHHATLMEYASANDKRIEYFRRRVPSNLPEIRQLLITHGA